MSSSAASSPRLGALLTLAWPIVIARATQAVIGFSDALMVAPLGENALAAVTTGAMNVFTFVMLPMGCVFILQSFAAQLRGRGELESVRRYVLYGLALAAVAGASGLVAIPLLPTLLGTVGYAPEVQQLMVAYLEPRLITAFAIVGAEAINNWYGGLGNTRIALWDGVLTMVINIIGNYLLIEPRFGLPGYGVAGAAWASAFAALCGFLFVLVVFARRIGQDLPASPLRFHWHEMMRVVRFGLPNGMNWFMEFAAFAFFINVVVGHLGTTVLAAFNVVFQINSISFMPAFGVASAGSILVGEAIGRRAQALVWPTVRVTLFVTGAWMVSVGVVYLLFPRQLFSLFETGDASASSLVAAGTTMLGLCGVWQLFDSIAITLSEALRSAGDTSWPMKARILLAWLLFTPLSWLAVFVFDGGVVTVMLSLVIYIAALAGLLAHRFRSGAWKAIELVGEPIP